MYDDQYINLLQVRAKLWILCKMTRSDKDGSNIRIVQNLGSGVVSNIPLDNEQHINLTKPT